MMIPQTFLKVVWLATMCVLVGVACRQAATQSAVTPNNTSNTVAASSPTSAAEPAPTEKRAVQKPNDYDQQRIQFKQGGKSATIKGSLAAGESTEYLLNGRKGQMMMVQITSRKKVDARYNHPFFTIYPPDDSSSGILNSDGFQWSGQLPDSGDYSIEVRAPEKVAASYELKVSIE